MSAAESPAPSPAPGARVLHEHCKYDPAGGWRDFQSLIPAHTHNAHNLVTCCNVNSLELAAVLTQSLQLPPP